MPASAPGASPALGIFGGTFDPIHYGHLELVREVRDALALQTVLLLPAGDPPHRPPPAAPARARLTMVELALADYPGLGVDAREIVRAGPSYTVLTLQELRQERPQQPLALILGADAFVGLPGWHRWREIFGLAHLVVVARPGAALRALPPGLAVEWQRRLTSDPTALEIGPAGSIFLQAITPHAISASAIRAELAAGQADRVRGLVPATVLSYIERNHLYRPTTDAT